MNPSNDLIVQLRALAERLAARTPEDSLERRLVSEAIDHLTTGSDGVSTALELELVAWTLEAQGRTPDAAILTRAAQTLATSGRRARAAQERSLGARRTPSRTD